jgi:hypothetical protein
LPNCPFRSECSTGRSPIMTTPWIPAVLYRLAKYDLSNDGFEREDTVRCGV